MKNLIMAFVLILSCTGLKAQNVKQDAQGNYVAIHHAKDTVAVKTTGKTYTDSKGKVYPVYVSSHGKLFVKKISAKGNEYKMYLKID